MGNVGLGDGNRGIGRWESWDWTMGIVGLDDGNRGIGRWESWDWTMVIAIRTMGWFEKSIGNNIFTMIRRMIK